MQTSFTDLVGTAVVPAGCFDGTELTDLIPNLDTTTAVHDMAAQASKTTMTAQANGVVSPTASLDSAPTDLEHILF